MPGGKPKAVPAAVCDALRRLVEKEAMGRAQGFTRRRTHGAMTKAGFPLTPRALRLALNQNVGWGFPTLSSHVSGIFYARGNAYSIFLLLIL